MKIVVASHNKKKIGELNALLGADGGGTVINDPVSAGAEVLDEDPLADLNSLINGDN